MKNLILVFSVTFLVLTGCMPTEEETNTVAKDYLLSSYYWMAGDTTPVTITTASVANEVGFSSINIYDLTGGDNTSDKYDFGVLDAENPSSITKSKYKINNYPEQGMVTYYDVAGQGSNLYKILTRTTFPPKDIYEYYTEEYYVKDTVNVGYWDAADPITTVDGSTDTKARVKMELLMADGGIRKEWIDKDAYWAGDNEKYGAFDYDNGSMDVPSSDSSIVDVTTDSSILWSSKVYYYQEIKECLSYWDTNCGKNNENKVNKELFGVRYYTEVKISGNEQYAYSHSYAIERIVSRGTVSTATPLTDSVMNSYIFGTLSDGTLLAGAVIREKRDSFNSRKNIKVKAVVYNASTGAEQATIVDNLSYTKQ